MGETLHAILDELDGALANIRKFADADFGPLNNIVGKLRRHADQQAAAVEQTAVADAESVAHDAEAAAAPIEAEVKTDAETLGKTVVDDAEQDLGEATGQPAPSVTLDPTGAATSSSPSPSASPSPATPVSTDPSSGEPAESSSTPPTEPAAEDDAPSAQAA